MNLFLDDVRSPKDAFLYNQMKYLEDYSGIPRGNWEIVRNYEEFVAKIEETGIPEAVSFDVDLHREHMRHYIENNSTNTDIYEWENFQNKCGIHCAKYLKSLLSENDKVKVYIHTANHVGRRIIGEIFKDYLA